MILELRYAHTTCRLTHLLRCPADLVADGSAQLRDLSLQCNGVGVHGRAR